MNNAQFWIDFLTPFLAPLATYVVGKYAKFIPSGLLGPICVALGTLGNGLASTALTPDANWWKAAALGLAGIGIRELQNKGRIAAGLVTVADVKDAAVKAENPPVIPDKKFS